MGIVSHNLKPARDPSAMESIRVLMRQGALSVNWYTHRGYRICCSLEPSKADGGYEWHVSVSFAGMPVDWDTAEKYGQILCPSVTKWERFYRALPACRGWFFDCRLPQNNR